MTMYDATWPRDATWPAEWWRFPNYPQLPKPKAQQGWECPRCSKVWAPFFVGPCPCHAERSSVTTTIRVDTGSETLPSS